MTAHEIYEILVGEIGHDTLLHKMRMTHIRAAYRGHNREKRTAWDTMRVNTWYILTSLGCEIDSPKDLLPMPWDSSDASEEDDEAAERLLAECREYNKKISSN